MDTSLIINAVNNNKKVTKAITNVNPEKDNVTLKTFAQMVNGLTTNNYVDATRVNKMSVEEEYSSGGGSADITLNVDTSHYDFSMTYSSVWTVPIESGVRINFSILEYDASYEMMPVNGYIDVTY